MRSSSPLVALAFAALLVTSMVSGPVSAGWSSPSTASADGASIANGALSGALAAESSGALSASTSASSGTTTTTASTTETTATNGTDGPQRWTPPDLPELDGTQPRDLDADGRYEDANGDGELGQNDVVAFFQSQHRPAWKHPAFDYSGNGHVGHGDVVTLFEAVATGGARTVIEPREIDADGDGLHDGFEREVAGTDPTDNDSDSSLTAADESDDGTPDGLEDLSGNGLGLAYAYHYDLNPLANDTDADGVPDHVEVSVEQLDPTAADTDGDGTPDGEADLDGDGLSNAQEAERGTSLVRADSDGDGIDDGVEVVRETDPLEPDSDGDGLPDGLELEYETDPLAADSDGDGTPDDEETYSVEHEHEETGVQAEAVGAGSAPTQLTLEQSTLFHHETPASASPTVRVHGADAQEGVELTLPITRDDHDTGDLAVYTLDPDHLDADNASWKRADGTVGVGGVAAWAEIESDQYVTVLNATHWRNATSVSVGNGTPAAEYDVTCGENCTIEDGAVVVDSTGDEEVYAFENPCTKSILNWYEPGCPGDDGEPWPGDSDDGSDDDGDSSDDDEEDDYPSGTPSGGWGGSGDDGDSSDDSDSSSGSDGSDGSSGSDGSDSSSGSDGQDGDATTISIPVEPGTVLVTAMYTTERASYDAEAEVIIDAGDDEPITDSLDFTGGALQPAHVDVSSMTGEEVRVSVDTTDARATLESVQTFTDRDSDGLVDEVEGEEIEHFLLGSPAQTDPELADTDGDSLEDGEEVSPVFTGSEWVVHDVDSDPTLTDTDGDGLEDQTEVELGTLPSETDSDGDGTSDELELQLGLDPTDSDTDGDGLEDGEDPAPLMDGDGSSETTLAEEVTNATGALSEGAALGEAGMPDGASTSEHYDSPFYIVGWLAGSFVPIGGTASDGRDLAQNLANGDWSDAALDGAGLIPLFGDATKGVTKLKQWLSLVKGKSEELLQAMRATGLLQHMPASSQENFYEAAGMGDDYKRVMTDGGKQLKPRIDEMNKWNSGKLSKGKRLTESDIARAREGPDGKTIVLTDTGKWESSREVTQTSGFRHVIARHVHPNTNHPDAFRRTDGYEVRAGEAAREGSRPTTSLFPKDMTPEEIQDLVMEAATSNNRQVLESRGQFETLYKYDVPNSYPYAINEVEVLIRDKSGMIKSAHPEGSKAPTVKNK